MYMYVCVYTYIYIYIYMYTHTNPLKPFSGSRRRLSGFEAGSRCRARIVVKRVIIINHILTISSYKSE